MRVHPAIAAGVAANEGEARMLDEAARLLYVSGVVSDYGIEGVRDDLLTAITRSSAQRLDNLGLNVQVPQLPLPEPDPEDVARFELWFGNHERAYATAQAIERIRQGMMTPRLAREEFQRRTLAAAQEAASR